MASNYTTNYRLCQWEASDKVLRAEFNADNAKIDAAIQAVEDRMTSALSGKASASALDTLKNTVSSQGSALELRNCRFVTGSYTGSGLCGEGKANTLTFPYKPVFVCVTSADYVGSFCAVREQLLLFHIVSGDQVKQVVSWGTRSLSWYNVENFSAPSADKQLNGKNKTYYYFALLEL